jgi:coniferyl-aldehyde dehydrogenase
MIVSKEYLMPHSETSTARLAQLQAQPLAERFALQQGAARGDPNPQRAVRERRLAALDQMLRDNAVAIGEAVSCDFGHRSPAETRLLELFPSYEAIRSRASPSAALDASAAALGVAVVPAGAGRSPLSAAWRRGHHRAVELPDFPGHRSACRSTGCRQPGSGQDVRDVAEHRCPVRHAGRQTFSASDELSVVEGDASVAQAFSQLPFDHLLFTGSTAVGHHVMRAAADI